MRIISPAGRRAEWHKASSVPLRSRQQGCIRTPASRGSLHLSASGQLQRSRVSLSPAHGDREIGNMNVGNEFCVLRDLVMDIKSGTDGVKHVEEKAEIISARFSNRMGGGPVSR